MSRVRLCVVLEKTAAPKAIDVAYYVNGCQMIRRTNVKADAIRVIEDEQIELRTCKQKMLPDLL